MKQILILLSTCVIVLSSAWAYEKDVLHTPDLTSDAVWSYKGVPHQILRYMQKSNSNLHVDVVVSDNINEPRIKLSANISASQESHELDSVINMKGHEEATVVYVAGENIYLAEAHPEEVRSQTKTDMKRWYDVAAGTVPASSALLVTRSDIITKSGVVTAAPYVALIESHSPIVTKTQMLLTKPVIDSRKLATTSFVSGFISAFEMSVVFLIVFIILAILLHHAASDLMALGESIRNLFAKSKADVVAEILPDKVEQLQFEPKLFNRMTKARHIKYPAYISSYVYSDGAYQVGMLIDDNHSVRWILYYNKRHSKAVKKTMVLP